MLHFKTINRLKSTSLVEYTIAANISANSLIDLAKIGHSALNKDKNSLCSAIDLSEKTIVDWYNEINLAYAPFRSHYILGEKISDKKIISDFLVFAESRTNSHAIESSLQFFDLVKVKWDAGELRRIVGDIDINLVESFHQNLKQFRDVVFNTKIIMLEHGVPKLDGNESDATMIANWIKKLDSIRSEIRTMAMKIFQQLKCDQQMFNKISNQ